MVEVLECRRNFIRTSSRSDNQHYRAALQVNSAKNGNCKANHEYFDEVINEIDDDKLHAMLENQIRLYRDFVQSLGKEWNMGRTYNHRLVGVLITMNAYSGCTYHSCWFHLIKYCTRTDCT